MQAHRRYLVCIVVMLAALLPIGPTQAQTSRLSVQIQPEYGPPGTVVTFFGTGAPPHTQVELLFAPFSVIGACRDERDFQRASTVEADADGRFRTTHQTPEPGPGYLGVTYLARLIDAAAPRPTSNLECFRFESGPDVRYFAQTGYTIRGRFLDFWDRNGALPVFGYPISFVRHEVNPDTGEQFQTQWFERARLELHTRNRAPYDVLLGRLGDDLLRQGGINWWTIPPAVRAAPGCLYFDETRHNLCNQEGSQGFMRFWQTHGLEFDGIGGTSYVESLALFGYPVTEAYTETNSTGDQILTQWFERARFEWHPNHPEPFRVLLGRIGAHLLARGR